jgi:DNA-binding NtrC family response regulator
MAVKKRTVLIADDEEGIRDLLGEICVDEGWRVVFASDGKEALATAKKEHPDAVVMDVRMPEMDGITTFGKMKAAGIDVPVILMTAYGSSDVAIEAMKQGAYDYITKPFDIEEMRLQIKKALKLRELTAEVFTLKTGLTASYRLEELIGSSSAMQQVYKSIGRIAASDATVLIRGESGTGKEVVARAIFLNSDRRERPFVAINCAAIPEGLLESELFGHEKGAFTDAIALHKGKFEQADDGTIFLDEIGDMALSLQSKVLRVLQDKSFERVGGKHMFTSEARILAATNQDLETLVKTKQFREDLYYRLNVMTITLPPLRERKDDLEDLIDHFVKKYCKKYDKIIAGISPQAIKLFKGYDWPGNVRELENAVARAVIIANSPLILPEYLPHTVINYKARDPMFQRKGELPKLHDAVGELEAGLIRRALKESKGNRTKAALMLGIPRRSLYTKIQEYSIDLKELEPGHEI